MKLRRIAIAGLVLVAIAIASPFVWRHAECSGFGRSPPTVRRWRGEGPVTFGAARVPFALPDSAVPAGYGPPRREAQARGAPLFARALVLRSGSLTVALISLDLLLVPESLAADVQALAAAHGVQVTMVAATHSHTSVGGFDERLVPQIVAIGRYRPEIRRAIVDAADRSITEALAGLGYSGIAEDEVPTGSLVRSRDRGEPVDSRLERIRFSGAAELLLLSAHPTLVERRPATLDADYPGRVAANAEAHGHVAIVLQGAIGNASASVPPGPDAAVERFARAVEQLDPQVARDAGAQAVSTPAELKAVEVTVPLPRPESRRLVPSAGRPIADALLCATAPRTAAVTEIRIGQLALLGIPGEPTAEVAHALEGASGARVVALTDGYLGYIETPAHVRARDGESKRQYFGPELYDALLEAARATRP